VLADFARRLVAAHRHEYRCIEIIVGDAAQFEVPDDLTLAPMFDPFRGKRSTPCCTSSSGRSTDIPGEWG
jgi:hypothetical protein